MDRKRLWRTIRLYTIRSARKRAEYLKKTNAFKAIGSNCAFPRMVAPLYSNLIKIGNNVKIASGVTFVTHDVIYAVLNDIPENKDIRFQEKMGCIDIHDNVFIGKGTTILYDVSIGSNVIIGAESLVNKDIPSGTVVGGVPARVICTFDEFVSKCGRKLDEPQIATNGEGVAEKTVNQLWKLFYNKRMNGIEND